MRKLVVFFLIFLIAIFLGIIYGIIHDQITYSISEEYYTKFKFIQFGLENWGFAKNIGTISNPEIHLKSPRIGAIFIGALATWWFGLIFTTIFTIKQSKTFTPKP